MDRYNIYNSAIDTFGESNQIIVAIEEMSELTQELTKYLRGSANIENITEEIADVEIMIEQLKAMYHNHYYVEKAKLKKIDRLKMRVEKGNQNLQCNFSCSKE